MSERGAYQQVPHSHTRRLSAISDISASGRHSLRPNVRDDISPLSSPAPSQRLPSDHKFGENNFTQDSLSSHSSSSRKEVSAHAKWLPATLRAYLIWIPTALALICGLVIMLLYLHSKKNKGLSPATTAIFGWKFVPTLVAVIYTQLTTILFDDVKRTEPFARMARPEGSVPSASRTLLETPRAWWITLAHGFQKKRNGGQRSWVLIMTCIVNVLAFLGISPLSSALLDTQTMLISRKVDIARLTPKNDAVLKLVDDRGMYFRTTAALLQGATTSPWISEDYAVLPFWPVDGPETVWNGPSFQSPRSWRAKTTVFHSDFKCSKLDLAATNLVPNVTIPGPLETPALALMASVRLDGSDGCQYNVTVDVSNPNELVQEPWVITWSDSNHLARNYDFYQYVHHTQAHPSVNDKCRGNETIILTTKWTDFDSSMRNKTTHFLPNMTTRGYMCSSELSMAVLDVDASVSETTFNVSFDRKQFQDTKAVVAEKLINTTDLLQISTDPRWYQYIPTSASIGGENGLVGVAALLATQYGLNQTQMFQDMDLDQKAAKVKSRLVSELLRSSIDAPGASQTESISGDETNVERRVRVSEEAAAILGGLFFLSFLLLLYITWASRLTQRPLNLVHDPATVVGTAALVANSAKVLSSLRGLDQATGQELTAALGNNIYATSPGQLHAYLTHNSPKTADSTSEIRKKDSDRSPTFLKIWTLLGLLLYLVALLAALGVVHRFATKSSLRQALFTYRVNSDAFGSFAPFSIIPTALGIGLGLWWNGMDRSFRSLQPYLAMSKTPIKVAQGAGVSYQSSQWLLASSRAAKNSHWLLALVTLGTFLAQAFIIAMSALFELNTGLVESQVSLNRSLEIRLEPHLRLESEVYPPKLNGSGVSDSYPYVTTTLQDLFTNLSTNWMYSASIQATMNGSQPPWSKDGWSFVPVDLSKVETLRETYQHDNSETQAMFINYSPVNVTLTTPAIRARLECSPTADVSNTSWWLEPYNYTDRANKTTQFNRLTYVWSFKLPGVNYSTPIAPDGQFTQCCFNQSEPSYITNFSMPLAVGYWTNNFGQRYGERSVTGDNGNFTIKWIHGEGGFEVYTGGSLPPIMFRNATKLQSLNCMPIIESSEAEITVDKQTRLVHSFTILRDPVHEDGAWSDSFVFHDPYDPNDPDFKAQLESSRNMKSNIYNYTYALQNMTTSYGILFTESLLRASRLGYLGDTSSGQSSMIVEALDDNVFNIRNNLTGLNMDFMSYASYIRARQDAAALLDRDSLIRHSQETFSLFFQHYVSQNVSLDTGGWAFQPIGAKIEDLRGIVNGTYRQYQPGGKAAIKVEDLPLRNTNPLASATMTTRVEVLDMNREAFLVCLVILSWLILTVLIVAALHWTTFKELNHNVESIADTLVLIAESDKFLEAVRAKGVQGLIGADVKTRMGWFRAEDGRMRRGIEIVQDGEVMVK